MQDGESAQFGNPIRVQLTRWDLVAFNLAVTPRLHVTWVVWTLLHSQRWMEHPEYPGAGPIFSLQDGDLTFSGSDMATLHMAFEIADLLSARIVGEEGEEDDLESLVIGEAGRD